MFYVVGIHKIFMNYDINQHKDILGALNMLKDFFVYSRIYNEWLHIQNMNI